jgi:hypothetical protein
MTGTNGTKEIPRFLVSYVPICPLQPNYHVGHFTHHIFQCGLFMNKRYGCPRVDCSIKLAIISILVYPSCNWLYLLHLYGIPTHMATVYKNSRIMFLHKITRHKKGICIDLEAKILQKVLLLKQLVF